MAAAGGEKTVLLAGATGLVGGLAVRHLLAPGAFARVVALARRPRPGPAGVLSRVVDFTHLHREPLVAAVAAVCALGTTIEKAGSREAFRAVDVDAVLAFARWAREGGASTFVLVSSVGADPGASSFYLRCKGEAEERVAETGFARFVALRPSLLLGQRSETRRGEAIAQKLGPLAGPLLAGPLRRYRAIDASVVAAAAARAALDPAPGRFTWEYDAIRG
jgi:uncharacterized protein YbjT (DUF2867 family)